MFRDLLSPVAENVVCFQIQISWLKREVKGNEKNLCQDVRHANGRSSHNADFTIFGRYLHIKVPIANTEIIRNRIEGRGLDS